MDGYRKILRQVWRPEVGEELFDKIRYSRLAKVADSYKWSKKTYNYAVSALRCAFVDGYRDFPEKHNPASALKCLRITKKDRPVIDPFTIQEAEALIAAIHRDWGEAQGNYDEFRFFTGLRPSEEIALRVTDCDVSQGKIKIDKARVVARDKDRTKTSEDRIVELRPRALLILKRHLALRARLKLEGKTIHEDLFLKDDGTPIRNLQYPWIRWRRTLTVTLKGRYREPYNARHSSVTWNLMIGKNPLWVAKQHGHSVQTMLETYAAWLEGTTELDLVAITRAMEGPTAAGIMARKPAASARPTRAAALSIPPESPRAVSSLSTDGDAKTQVPDNWWKLMAGERDSKPRRAFDPYTLSRAVLASKAVYTIMIFAFFLASLSITVHSRIRKIFRTVQYGQFSAMAARQPAAFFSLECAQATESPRCPDQRFAASLCRWDARSSRS